MSLLHQLPTVRGRYTENAPLSRYTWFNVGGPAEVLYKPADVEDLCHFLQNKPADVPVTVIGVGSNLLVRDGGVAGVVIRLGRQFAQIEVKGDTIYAGAAALDQNIARTACDHGLTGLEFLSGIPGTMGGALRMNAGAYGHEIKDMLIHAHVVDGQGQERQVPVTELGYTYRHSTAPADWIFVGGLLQARPGDPAQIQARMDEIRLSREGSQPVRGKTGGSTFKNPAGHKAWQLVDAAGCRGLTRGGAQVSEKHCNFLLNIGDATAADLEGLGEEVQNRVRNKTNIELQWEIIRLGSKANLPNNVN